MDGKLWWGVIVGAEKEREEKEKEGREEDEEEGGAKGFRLLHRGEVITEVSSVPWREGRGEKKIGWKLMFTC